MENMELSKKIKKSLEKLQSMIENDESAEEVRKARKKLDEELEEYYDKMK